MDKKFYYRNEIYKSSTFTGVDAEASLIFQKKEKPPLVKNSNKEEKKEKNHILEQKLNPTPQPEGEDDDLMNSNFLSS
jgi:hypothetical protein